MTSSEIVLAIASAIIGGFILNGLTLLWIKTISPIYRNWVYDGVKVDGDWTIEQDEKAADGEGFLVKGTWQVILEQRAHIISGHATVTHSQMGGATSTFKYDIIDGYIHDRVISLIMRGRDSSRIAYSTFLLEVCAGGTMEGYRNFFGNRKKEVRSVRCVWKQNGVVTCKSKVGMNKCRRE